MKEGGNTNHLGKRKRKGQGNQWQTPGEQFESPVVQSINVYD